MQKKLREWVEKPKVEIDEVPRSSDVIIQLFLERINTNGVIVDGKITDKKLKDYKIQAYPYGYVISSHEEGQYKEGSIVYLTDNILISEVNPDWISWEAKIENSYGVPHDPEPPKFIGGLSEIEMFRFKYDKLKKESDEVDEELYQLPNRIIKGVSKWR